MTALVLSILNKLYSFLQIRRATIKAWMRVCEIEISHVGKNNGNPDLVCGK